MYSVAIVCEGPTDRAIIEAVLDSHLDDYEPRAIQPPISRLGEQLSAGWKGVRAWCEQEASTSAALGGIHDNSDLLIIQLDADVATEEEIGLTRSCPPPQDMANEVRLLIGRWLGLSTLPSHTLLCVPAMASETWALVALFPHDSSVVSCLEPVHADGPCIECREDVKTLLRRLARDYKPKLVVSDSGRLKNQSKGYIACQDEITQAWPSITRLCGEAARFDAELRQVLP